MIEPKKYARKPFTVEAIRVTPENIDEVATWCKGAVETEDTSKFIRVKVANVMNERQTKAFAGDWVLRREMGGFKVYTDRAFMREFEELPSVSSGESDAKQPATITL